MGACYAIGCTSADLLHGVSALLFQFSISQNRARCRWERRVLPFPNVSSKARKIRAGHFGTCKHKQLGKVNSPQQQNHRMTAGQNYCFCIYASVSRTDYRDVRVYRYFPHKKKKTKTKPLQTHIHKEIPHWNGKHAVLWRGKRLHSCFSFSSINRCIERHKVSHSLQVKNTYRGWHFKLSMISTSEISFFLSIGPKYTANCLH